MIRVLVLGQSYWATRLARALNSRADDMRATFIPEGSYLRLLARRPRSERVVIMRAGYRVGATTRRGRLFDAYWSLLRRSLPDAVPCHYWLGTDVLNTLEEARAGTLRWGALTSAREDLHLADASWLATELESVGLQATTAHVPLPNHAPTVVTPLPPVFSVLTYLQARKFNFYGGEAILEAARCLPDVRFDVVGMRGEHAPKAPANVHWHGWVSDMAPRYAETTVVMRIPRHDGLGRTVIEGLSSARHVVYTHEVPFVRTVWPATPAALVETLGELRDAHAAGRLGPNLAGRAYALEEFDEVRLVDHLVALLRARA